MSPSFLFTNNCQKISNLKSLKFCNIDIVNMKHQTIRALPIN